MPREVHIAGREVTCCIEVHVYTDMYCMLLYALSMRVI